MELYKINHTGYSHLERLSFVAEAVLVTERITVMLIHGTRYVAWNSHFMYGMIETVLDEACRPWE